MRKGDGNFVEAEEVRLIQFVSLALEDGDAGVSMTRNYSMGRKDVTVKINIIVEDNEYAKSLKLKKDA